jgi:ABC-type phosphate transport system auxiliary subunit
MTTPKEIAERIIKQCDGLRNYQQLFEFDRQFETLARAYLELEKERKSPAYVELENSRLNKEVVKLREELANLKSDREHLETVNNTWAKRDELLQSEIAKLKEELERLRK